METLCGCCLLRAADKDLQTPFEIYSHMLRECFGIHMTLSDDDSCGICLVCVGRLRDACDFKLQVQRTQAVLQAQLQGGVSVKKEEIAVDSETEDGAAAGDEPVSSKKEEERDYQKVLEDVNILEEMHVKLASHGDREIPEDVQKQQEASKNSEELDEAHKLLSGPNAGDSAAEAKAEPVLSMSARAREQLAQVCCVRLERLRDSPCPVSSHREPSPASSVQDVTSHREPSPASSVQDVTSHRESSPASSVQDAPAHTHAVSADRQPYTCDTCQTQFTDKATLITHIQNHFTRTDESEKVLVKHDGKKPYKGGLDYHERTHSGDKPYRCRECNKLFAAKSSLNRHERIHSGVKPYSCEECNEGFTRKVHIDAHRRRIHKGLDWNMHFTQKVTLESHRITQHSDEERDKHLNEKSSDVGVKPYSCEECNNKFTLKCELERHKRIHTGEESYECEICECIFFDEASLITHVNTHATKIVKP
ncbi:histone-lysine N-methyltransferase PRDM9-like [Cydia amplana]|uniref:histone-lysine N-methyltransferase PRDM9-like n=1 Tax=Cydia amplana TaxID=1869771 RepID=UPI002FE680BE